MKKALSAFFVIAALATTIYFSPISPLSQHADAQSAISTPSSLTGYAWSSNIGWLSFSDSNEVAAGVTYGVARDASGNLTGYAWSSNIGWIKFGGLDTVAMPNPTTAPGTQQVNAKVNTSTGRLEGWARACAGMSDSLHCIDTVSTTNLDTNDSTQTTNALTPTTLIFDYATASNGQTSANGQYQWTVPVGVTSVQVKAWGGGGLGLREPRTSQNKGGGGGGLITATVPVISGSTFTIVVGEGGNGYNTGKGGDSSFISSGVTISASGGLFAGYGGTGGSTFSSVGASSFSTYVGGNGGSGTPGPTISACGGGGAGGGGLGGFSAHAGEIGYCPGTNGSGPSTLGGGKGGEGMTGIGTPGGSDWYAKPTVPGGGADSYPNAGAPGRIIITYTPPAVSITPTLDPRGGFTGWISLSGLSAAGNYGIQLDSTGQYSGYAWGSDVIGWLQFNTTEPGGGGPGGGPGGGGGGGPTCPGVCEVSPVISLTCPAPTRSGTSGPWTWTATISSVFKGTAPYTFAWTPPGSSTPEPQAPISPAAGSLISASFTAPATSNQFATVSVVDSQGHTSQTTSCSPVPEQVIPSVVEFGATAIPTAASPRPTDAASYRSAISMTKGKAVALRYVVSSGNASDTYSITQSGPADATILANTEVVSGDQFTNTTTLGTEGTYTYTLKIFSAGQPATPKSSHTVTVTVRNNPDLNEF